MIQHSQPLSPNGEKVVRNLPHLQDACFALCSDEWLQWTEFEKALYPKAASRRQAHEILSTLKEHRAENAFRNIFIALNSIIFNFSSIKLVH